MSDEELLTWFRDFSCRLDDSDLKCLTLFIENLSNKYRLGKESAYLLGLSTGKELTRHGTH